MSATRIDSASFCEGRPRFHDGELERLAAEDVASAWARAFTRYGIDAPRHVTGDFAVALRLPDGRVFLAVDRFAMRTLCYRVVGERLAFARRADELARDDARVAPQAVFDYLYFHAIPAPTTIFAGVKRLPAAHSAVFERGALTVKRYWTARFDERRREPLPALKQTFLKIVRDCVADQVGDKEVGCFLSGGTDSSTVAGMLRDVTGRPARTFSIGFDAAGFDEMAFARIAARHFATDHHEYYVTPDDLVRSIPEIAKWHDQPFGNSSVLPAYFCARMAREAGVEKLLGGDGGDELFGGNSRYAKQRVFEAYQAIPRALRASLIEPALLGTALPSRVPVVKKAASYVRQARVPMPARSEMYNLLHRMGAERILTPEFLAAVDVDAPLREQERVYGACEAESLVNRMLHYDWTYTLADNDLPKVIAATSIAGIDAGFPLLDQRLVDFSLALAPEYKLRGLKLRWFFKEALRGFLPDEIIAKRKHGFGLPFGAWLVRHRALRELAFDSVHALRPYGIVRRDFLDELMNELVPRFPDYYGEMVWILVMLQQWLASRREARWPLSDTVEIRASACASS